MRAKITKRTVDAVVPGTRDTFLWDTEIRGFGLKVTPAGKRIYVLQTRVEGRLRRYTIGGHGSPWTPDKAREEAVRLLGMIAGGTDPADAKAHARRDITVAQLCDLYLTEGCGTKKASTIAMDRSRIKRHVEPLLGSKRLRTLGRADVERFMADVAAGKTAREEKTKPRGRAIVRGGRGVATRAVGMLGAILRFAVDRGLRPDNPARGVKRYRDRKNERFLSPKELADLGRTLSAAERESENAYGVAAIRLLILTGCRKNEVLSMRWDWIDFDRAALRLPDSKTGAKVVPLGTPALELLASLPRIEGNPHVFPGATIDRHLIGLQKVWARLRERAGIPDVRLHDLRHSFASVGAASGNSLLVIGALLGHRDAGTAARYAHLTNDPLRAAADRIAGQIAAAMKSSDSAEVVKLSSCKV